MKYVKDIVGETGVSSNSVPHANACFRIQVEQESTGHLCAILSLCQVPSPMVEKTAWTSLQEKT